MAPPSPRARARPLTGAAVTRITDTTARRDAERLGKAERSQLPRVTAYATANSYNMDGLMRFLKARAGTRGAAPRKYDECIFTPYSYTHEAAAGATEDLINLHEHDAAKNMPTPAEAEDGDDGDDTRSLLNFVAQQNRAIRSSDVFLFQYGVVVIWGMSVDEEKRFLRDIAKFETEKLGEDDVQVENFNFYVTSSYQPRIYNDFITLKDGRNYMVKLSISHAIAQSVKVGWGGRSGGWALTRCRFRCLRTWSTTRLKTQSRYRPTSPPLER